MEIENEEQSFFDYLMSLRHQSKAEAESEAHEDRMERESEAWDYEVKEDVESVEEKDEVAAPNRRGGVSSLANCRKSLVVSSTPTKDRGEEKCGDAADMRLGDAPSLHANSPLFSFYQSVAVMKELIELKAYMMNNIVDFEIWFSNGRLCAGRTPIRGMV